MPGGPDHDVLIIGAGITGIGVACHLERNLPDTSYAILDARDSIGGTWDLFRYPGIRSDVDMFTFGYSFSPWHDPDAIVGGDAILAYLERTARDHGVDRHIDHGLKVTRADWDGDAASWTVQATRTSTGETVTRTARWIFSATGYFSHETGHAPDLPGLDRFEGTVVHPQFWPEDLDHTGKRVVVIGSGATAVTLLPSMAETGAAHVTMLQRSPTYIVAVPHRDPLVRLAFRVLPSGWAYAFARRRSLFIQELVWALSKRRPGIFRSLLLKGVARQLPDDYDVDTHFTPRYDPWDQRLCIAPGGDIFRAIRQGKATVVTDTIETFTADGIRTRSGDLLEADIVVTATGLELLAFGGIDLVVDGEAVTIPERVIHRGSMLSGVPNFIFSFPYPHVALTTRVEVVSARFERILRHMAATGCDTAVPVNSDPNLETHPFGDYTSGYVMRSRHLFPQSGNAEPWTFDYSVRKDSRTMREGPLEDGVLRFSRGTAQAQTPRFIRTSDRQDQEPAGRVKN